MATTLFDTKFTKTLAIKWDSDARLTDEEFTAEAKAALQPLIEAEKVDEYAAYPDDFTVTRAFIDSETAEVWTETMRVIGAKYGYNMVEVNLADSMW